MNVVYVNRKTGEIFDAELLTLSNLCNGQVEEQFQNDLHLLSSRMVKGDTASITIKITCGKDITDNGEPIMVIAAESSLALPKVKIEDTVPKNINEQNDVLIKKEPKNLFDNLPQLPEDTTPNQNDIIDAELVDDDEEEDDEAGND